MSLSKLKNKYFATRCVEGHVNIWSATNHPDRLFTLFNIDADEELFPIVAPPKPEPIVVAPKKKIINDDGEEVDEEEDEPIEEEKPKKKTKLEPVRPVAPKLVDGAPVPSEKDTMIELKWKGLI